MNEALKRAKRELERAGYEVRPRPTAVLLAWQEAAQKLIEAASELYQTGNAVASREALLAALRTAERNGAWWWRSGGLEEAIRFVGLASQQESVVPANDDLFARRAQLLFNAAENTNREIAHLEAWPAVVASGLRMYELPPVGTTSLTRFGKNGGPVVWGQEDAVTLPLVAADCAEPLEAVCVDGSRGVFVDGRIVWFSPSGAGEGLEHIERMRGRR